MLLNDAQSRLNQTRVARLVSPRSTEDVVRAVRDATRENLGVSVAGGRHAMGGQQFLAGGLHLDMSGMDGIVGLDRTRGWLTVQGGTQWPKVIAYLHEAQRDDAEPWAIRQKQTGVDEVSLAGSLGANIHGRGLRMGPMVDDIESFRLVEADGNVRHCSRAENAEWFALAIGGYGLFGVVVEVTLRLKRRQWLQRVVEPIAIRDLRDRATQRILDGYLYGDCQFAIDLAGDAAEHRGIFSCYRPVDVPPEAAAPPRVLPAAQWAELYALARRDKRAAFAAYLKYYRGSSGQVYACDRSQLSSAFAGYRDAVEVADGTEMITEVYVPAEAMVPLLAACRADFVQHGVDLMYGTIRLIEPDTTTFLPWARQQLVCVVCNLHVTHTPAGIAKAQGDFQRITDRAIEHGGHYYLTYHRWARRDQVLTCYPNLPAFLQRKRDLDPAERFQNDWYRHHAALFSGGAA